MPIGYSIHDAKAVLDAGNLVAIPTETVYGLAANALYDSAVAKVFSAKKRPTFDPLIVHIKDAESMLDFAEVSDKLGSIAKNFWPGPLTILAPKKDNISDLVTAGNKKVALRVPNHPATLQLLQLLNYPLVAPSANPFGYVSPTSAQHVLDNLGSEVDYILDGGSCKIGLESTIISEENGQIIIHRLGGLKINDLTAFIGHEPLFDIQNNSNPKAPGMLDKHYSPISKLYKYNPTIIPNKGDALICFGKEEPNGFDYLFNLSKTNDMEEAASNLFSILRKLDEHGIEIAFIMEIPNEGLGKAINDRINRAIIN